MNKSSLPVVLDSSVWIEIFAKGSRHNQCEFYISKPNIIVPSLVLYEVYKYICSQVSEDLALSVIAQITQHKVQDLNKEIALFGADLSLNNKIAMADAIVLSTAYYCNAELITLDNDFTGFEGVKVIR